MLASICCFVSFVYVDEGGEGDAEPIVCAHQIAFCDSSALLGEDETVEFVDCEGEIVGGESAAVGVEMAFEGVDVVESEEGEAL